MQSSIIGWNIEGGDLGGRRETTKIELLSYRANWHLCLGDLDLALQLLRSTDKGVIFRVFDPFNEWTDGSVFDNKFWLNHSPQKVVNYLKNHHEYKHHLDKFVWSIGNNEPTTRGNTKAFVEWCVRLAQLGFEHGIRFAIAEIATAKTVEYHEVENGVWDDLIATMHMYRGFHIFTIHEYTTGILPAQALPDYPLNLDNPDALAQSNWQHAKINLDTLEGNYHIGRGALVSHVRAKQLGLEPLPFVVTECAFDWMYDIVSSPERVETIGHLANRFRFLGHDFMRGSTGHLLYHEWLMRETGFQGDWNDYLFEQYKWLVNAYPSECEGLTIFALNKDWDIPEGHDMSTSRNDKFRQLVIDNPVNKDTSQPPPVTDFVMERKLISSKQTTNIRFGWGQGAKLYKTLRNSDGNVLDVLISDKPVIEADGYAWYQIEYNDTVLYAAETNNLVIDDVIEVPPVDNEPDSPDTPTEPPSDIPGNPDYEPPVIDMVAIQAMVEAEISKQNETLLLDIPIGDFTMTIRRSELTVKRDEWKGLSLYYETLYKAAARANGDLLAEDVANEVFTSSSAPFIDNDEFFANVSTDANPIGKSLLDEILNGQDDAA